MEVFTPSRGKMVIQVAIVSMIVGRMVIHIDILQIPAVNSMSRPLALIDGTA